MRFFVGLHQPSDAHRVDAAFISGKLRGLRTILWAAGGEIPPADRAA
jgi:hypothetical protein